MNPLQVNPFRHIPVMSKSSYSIIYENNYGRVSQIVIEAYSTDEAREEFYNNYDVDNYIICQITKLKE